MFRVILLQFLVVSFLASNPSFAAMQYSKDYKRVDKMFEEGTTFEYTDFLGWWSGRCWYAHSNEPTNGLLILDQRKTDGPAFEPVKKFDLVQMQAEKENFFEKKSVPRPGGDTLKSKREKMIGSWEQAVSKEFDKDWKDISEATRTVRGYQGSYAHLPMMRLRRSADDKYFVLKRGEVLVCYFFKSVDGYSKGDAEDES